MGHPQARFSASSMKKQRKTPVDNTHTPPVKTNL
jgi:hypothetical protein